ncbi:hypothetical protein Hanom_Chr07g00655491 [Helianthus anomalus]
MERTPPSNCGSKSRQVVVPVAIRNEIVISSEISANGKSSHIKKSIRTIRKLISGSEKRIV